MKTINCFKCLFAFLIFQIQIDVCAQKMITHDKQNASIVITDGKENLVLNLQYKNKCIINEVQVMGQKVVTNTAGIYSAIQVKDKWFTTGDRIPDPKISINGDRVEISDIIFGEKNRLVVEKWIFKTYPDHIDWTIERKYPGQMVLEDTGFPQWSFENMKTWTGALLGTGGVAWCKFFDKINASLANHTGEVALWNQENKSGLSIIPVEHAGQQMAVRFSRQPDNRWTLNYTASEKRMDTKHTLSRFIINRQDIWDTLMAKGTAKVTYRLTAFDYDKAYYRGEFPGFNGESIRSVLNTIARVGIIDENIMGSNNWHLSAGFAVLHEHWIAQMGLAINDPNYYSNYQKTLDYFRDNAISKEGRVKSRWAYNDGDAEPGTYDAKGFYEAQWGRLLDANTSQVINVAELFQLNGNLGWVRTHKTSCEKVLEFLLRRDSDNDGLVEVMTDSYKEKRGSDWIDVIWASYENAFINAELYQALVEWAEVEKLLGDSKRAENYTSLAAKLKKRFNQSTKEGGFWDTENEWYVYWRDKDDRIHGDNLVTPVNFMAIAYGICDEKNRQAAILKKTEALMQNEHLFMWPISFLPFAADEGYKVNFPFPNYENGDIFLGWGELGVRAYQDYDPEIPVRYIRNVLTQYEKDGLAFQRYDRKKSLGQGNDILANNCMSVVGLYRNIYGIQPKYNRLYLEPHLTEDLNGTKLKYWLRNQYYMIELSMGNYKMSANSFSINSGAKFGMHSSANELFYFHGNDPAAAMKIIRNKQAEVRVNIVQWDTSNTNEKKWKISASDAKSSKWNGEIFSLIPGRNYSLVKNDKPYLKVKSDGKGKIVFSSLINNSSGDVYILKLIND
ncbi:MAG: hypothetical protein ABIN89_18900 [Chitinophagaceae bacterium]